MSFRSSRRNLRLVIGAKAVSFLGDQMAAVALVLRLQSHGAGAGQVAALLVADLVPIVALAGVAGRLVDRLDTRRLLVASGLAQAVVCAVLVWSSSFGLVVALVALLGCGQAVNGSAWQSLLAASAGERGVARAVSASQAATTLAGIAAPALAGVLVGTWGAGAALLVDTASFVALAVAAALLRIAPLAAAGDRGDRSGGFAIVRRDPLLRAVLTVMGLFVVLGGAVNVVEVFLVRGALGASPTWYGLSAAGFSIGVFAGALAAGRVASGRGQAYLVVFGAAGLGLGLAGMGVSPDVGVLVAVGAVAGVCNGLINVATGALVLGRARPGERGRVAALQSAVVSGGLLGSYVVSGLVANVLGPREIFVGAGVLAAAAALTTGPAVLRAVAHPASGVNALPGRVASLVGGTRGA